MTTLVIVYIIALIVGGGLLLISLALGNHGETDVHADVSADVTMDVYGPSDLHHHVDAGHHGGGGHALSLTRWFSLQFAVYFLAIFGLIGTTMTFLAKARPGVVFAAAVFGGLIVGQLVHQALRVLRRTGVGSDLTSEDYLHQPARVTIALHPSKRGEVAVGSRNGERFLAAVARRADDRFKAGDRVFVVGFTNGVAEVVSKEEYEFISGSNDGGTS